MADLATTDELALVLGLSESEAETDGDLLELLLDSAEAVFEGQIGRPDAPFQAAQTGRVEIVEAPRGRKLWLDYPVNDVTAIALGLDVAIPEDTLDPDDTEDVVWRQGERLLTRTDGGLWHIRGQAPSYVKVTYDTQDDLPGDAKLAVLGLAKRMYQRTGTEGLRSETLDNYSVTFAQELTTEDPAWQLAVNHHRRFVAA